MVNFETQYLDLLKDILENGVEKDDRTGIGTLSVFGRSIRADLSAGFPIVTTKKVHFKSAVFELLWFLSGDHNIKFLNDNGVSIWDEWVDKDGNLGPVYGVQWRNWNGIDQIREVIQQIKDNPNSRRLLVSAWNVSDIPKMALAPCHTHFQFNVTNGKLSCVWFQRSCDTLLGIPFNFCGYALLTHFIAQVTGLEVGDLVWFGGDVHIYKNHIEQVKLQLSREPYPLPKLKLSPNVKDIDDFLYEDISLEGYKCHPAIKAPIAV